MDWQTSAGLVVSRAIGPKFVPSAPVRSPAAESFDPIARKVWIMGLFDFLKDAGEDLGRQQEEAAELKSNQDKAAAMTRQVEMLGLKVEDLQIGYDDGVVTVNGSAPSQEEREKLILLLGNIQGVARVDDRLNVEKPEAEATFYTVKSGDSLSRIAKAHYGDAMKYPVIFEANRPMLKDPDKIYPGQVLRIPALDA
jgi:nucleoid-associated protein YgaU